MENLSQVIPIKTQLNSGLSIFVQLKGRDKRPSCDRKSMTALNHHLNKRTETVFCVKQRN